MMFPGPKKRLVQSLVDLAEKDTESLQENASKDAANFLRLERRKEKSYAAVVVLGLICLGIVSLALFIFDVIFIAIENYDYLRVVSITYLAIRSFVFLLLVFMPYVIYSLDIAAISNAKDMDAIVALRITPEYMLSRDLYHTPNYLYDTRDSRNRRNIFAMCLYVVSATVLTIWFYASIIHYIDTLGTMDGIDLSVGTNYSDVIIDYNITLEEAMERAADKVTTSRISALVLACTVIHLFESFLIFNKVHLFFRRAIPPPPT